MRRNKKFNGAKVSFTLQPRLFSGKTSLRKWFAKKSITQLIRFSLKCPICLFISKLVSFYFCCITQPFLLPPFFLGPSTYESSLEIVEYLQTKKFNGILTINPPTVFNAKGMERQTFSGGVNLLNMYRQQATSDSLIEAQEAAYSSFVDYLNAIAKFICNSPQGMVRSESCIPSKNVNGQEQALLLVNGGDNSGCSIASPKKPNDSDTPLTLNRCNSGRTVCPYSASDLNRAIQSLQVAVKPAYINPVKVISNAVSQVNELAKLIGKFISGKLAKHY